MAEESPLIIPQFFIHTVQNERKSKDAGRPIFDEFEAVRIFLAANKQTVGVFPAASIWRNERRPDGSIEPITYAMRFSEQYQKFKNNEAQIGSGTPLSELPFLTASKRLELKALHITTAETLAALDGAPLKQLGMGGRELKNQAQAYLDNAAGSADVTRLAADNVQLKAQLETMQKQFEELAANVHKTGKAETPAMKASAFADWDDADLKNWIGEQTGARPKGNPNHATLVATADEINAQLSATSKTAQHSDMNELNKP